MQPRHRSSVIRQQLARCAPLKAAYQALRTEAMRAVCRVSPELLVRLRHREARGRWPNLSSPTTFDEKLLWLNLYWRHPLKTECGDKYTLRSFVERQGFGHLLPRIYGAFETALAIDFQNLPQRFVLKCTHGSKCNIFCPEKTDLDIPRAQRDLTRWLDTDYSKLLGELHYGGMKPRIICEEFLDDGTGALPRDYKLYCFGGHFHCTEVCSGRTPNGKANSDYMDRTWSLLPYDDESLAAKRCIARPACYEEMIYAAERLSAPFPFVRVDFYCIQNRAILGELTFTPSACIDTSQSELANRVLGDLIELPDKRLNPASAS